MDTNTRISEIPPPGEPLRQWSTFDPELSWGDALHSVLASDSEAAVKKLMSGSHDLSKDELISLGKLNYYCFLKRYEPMVHLFQDMVEIDPSIPGLIGDRL